MMHMSRVRTNPAFCICENKDADQRRGNREADQRLCFCFTDSTISKLKLVCFSFFVFRYSIKGEVSLLFVFRFSFFAFRFSTFEFGRISYFDIRNPILTFELRPNIEF